MIPRAPHALTLLTLLALLAGCSGAPEQTRLHPRVIDDPAQLEAIIAQDLAVLQTGVEAYYQRYDALPERLPDLLETPDGVALIDAIPRDPWRVPYLLRRLDHDIVLYSTGADLIIGTDDDLSRRLSFEGVARNPPAAPEQTASE